MNNDWSKERGREMTKINKNRKQYSVVIVIARKYNISLVGTIRNAPYVDQYRKASLNQAFELLRRLFLHCAG